MALALKRLLVTVMAAGSCGLPEPLTSTVDGRCWEVDQQGCDVPLLC